MVSARRWPRLSSSEVSRAAATGRDEVTVCASLIDFICRVLAEAEQFATTQDGSMTRLSGDTPHNWNAATISHKSTFLQGYLLFSQFF